MRITAADIGTGARTVLTQIAADALGIGTAAAVANAAHHATGNRVRDLPIRLDRLLDY